MKTYATPVTTSTDAVRETRLGHVRNWVVENLLSSLLPLGFGL